MADDQSISVYAKIGAAAAAAWATYRGAKKVLSARVQDQGDDIETLRSQYESLQQEVSELRRKSNERLDRMEFELAEARKDIIETQVKSESATRHFSTIERALRELRVLFEQAPARELPRD